MSFLSLENINHIDLMKIALDQIEERNLAVPAGWPYSKTQRRILDVSIPDDAWLVYGSGWHKYGRQLPWRTEATYLVGYSDNQHWAVKVPSTLDTVKEALAWLEPPQATQARIRKLPVKRQGDFYFVARARNTRFDAMEGTRHEARPHKQGGYTVVHPEHPPVRLSGRHAWLAVQQKQLDGHGRRGGD